MPKFKDPIMAGLAAKYGQIKIVPSKDIFGDIVESILSQQLSGKAANTIITRVKNMITKFTPEEIVATEDQKIRDCGVSWAKIKYIKDLSTKVLDGTVALNKLADMSDEAMIEHLVVVKGIGRWTAEMMLMFTFARPDVFPLDDLGIQNSVIKNYGLKRTKSLRTKMIKISDSWRPHRTYASRLLWKSLDNRE